MKKVFYILLTLTSILISCKLKQNQKIHKIHITIDNIQQENELSVFIPKNQDSIRVYFPNGGTVSEVSFYLDSTLKKKAFKSISYSLMDTNNFLNFSKKDIGRYYACFGSCHWSKNFWFQIK